MKLIKNRLKYYTYSIMNEVIEVLQKIYRLTMSIYLIKVYI